MTLFAVYAPNFLLVFLLIKLIFNRD